jgi:hypothetical protein
MRVRAYACPAIAAGRVPVNVSTLTGFPSRVTTTGFTYPAPIALVAALSLSVDWCVARRQPQLRDAARANVPQSRFAVSLPCYAQRLSFPLGQPFVLASKPLGRVTARLSTASPIITGRGYEMERTRKTGVGVRGTVRVHMRRGPRCQHWASGPGKRRAALGAPSIVGNFPRTTRRRVRERTQEKADPGETPDRPNRTDERVTSSPWRASFAPWESSPRSPWLRPIRPKTRADPLRRTAPRP